MIGIERGLCATLERLHTLTPYLIPQAHCPPCPALTDAASRIPNTRRSHAEEDRHRGKLTFQGAGTSRTGNYALCTLNHGSRSWAPPWLPSQNGHYKTSCKWHSAKTWEEGAVNPITAPPTDLRRDWGANHICWPPQGTDAFIPEDHISPKILNEISVLVSPKSLALKKECFNVNSKCWDFKKNV